MNSELNGPGDILPAAAKRYGAKEALVSPTRALSFVELDDLSSRFAAAVIGQGVGPGDRITLYSENRWEWVVAYHGILRAGAVVNPLNQMLTPGEVAHVVGDCRPVAFVGSLAALQKVHPVVSQTDSIRSLVSFDSGGPRGYADFGVMIGGEPMRTAVEIDPLRPSTIGYTSGTTGHPKGAVQSHRAVVLNCTLTATMHVRTSDDRLVTALPAAHVYGNVAINSTLLAGGTVVLMERFAPETALALIRKHRATMFEGVPTMYALMLAHPNCEGADLTSLTRCTVGGQTIAESTIEEWEAKSSAPLLELWGMTELAGLGTTHPLYAPNIHGSIGVALPGVELRVADLTDASITLGPGVAGELMVRGPLVMLGYHGNPDATAETIEDDGWLHTGDVVVRDESNHFFVVDRRKDVILTAGYNVYPAEIERVVSGHPAVAMVAVGRQLDELKGELARAYIVLRPGHTATELEILDHCRSELAAYKVPRSVKFVDELPKTSSGKVLRRELSKLD